MNLPATFNGQSTLNVIIETPKFSTSKITFDPATQLFKLSRRLPVGMQFPFDFGFVPGTRGDDGDPLDIMILSDQSLFVGAWAAVSVIGVLEAEQIKEGQRAIRNDRLIGSLLADPHGPETVFDDVRQLPGGLRDNIEAFFVQYNLLHGDQFIPMGWRGARRAITLVKEGIKKAEIT